VLTGSRDVIVLEELKPERSINANNYLKRFIPTTATSSVSETQHGTLVLVIRLSRIMTLIPTKLSIGT
jgi:hypothetical protein